MFPRSSSDVPSNTGAEPWHHDGVSGSLRSRAGRRFGFMPLEFVRALHFEIVGTFGEKAQDVLYRCGYEWALRDLIVFQREHTADVPARSREKSPAPLVQAWWAPHASAGWGSLTFDESLAGRGLLLVDLEPSIVARTLGETDDPVCHLYAGLLAGACSFLTRTERHAAEIQCAALGAPTCRFVIGPGPEIDAAEAWRQHGTAPAEIVRRLRG